MAQKHVSKLQCGKFAANSLVVQCKCLPNVPCVGRDFYLDVDCVTNEQFDAFTEAANYTTESELYG